MNFFLTEWFYYLLKWLHSVFNSNYVLTIIAATLVLRLIQLFPDIKNRKTQIKTAAIQPELDALKKRYEDNPQKLQQEQNKLMKKNGVSMWSSCLPLLLTLPLFFCFLDAFRCWGNEETIQLMYETAAAAQTETLEDDDAAMQTFDSFKFLWVHNVWQADSMFAGVVPEASAMQSLKAKKLANMPLLEKGYTNANGETVTGEQIWSTLIECGLASGAYGDEGSGSSCSSCSNDRSGMILIPDTIGSGVDSASIDLIMGTTAEPTTEPTDEATAEPTTEPTADATAGTTAGTTAEATAEPASEDALTGKQVYDSLMNRYIKKVQGTHSNPMANGLFILPVLAAGLQFLTMLLTQRRTKSASGAKAQDDKAQKNDPNKSMKYMMYFMPLISIWVCISSTSAFAFYWTVSGLFQLISTLIINYVFDRKAKKQEVIIK